MKQKPPIIGAAKKFLLLTVIRAFDLAEWLCTIVARLVKMPMSPRLTKPSRVLGRTLVFRNASVGDAEFILALRTDPQKSKHLSRVSASLEDQTAWLKRYAEDHSQSYFIIETPQGSRLGTVRLYDPRGDSFCWGSWILVDNRPATAAVESALMVYRFARACGFARSHFDVRKANLQVLDFHDRFGATRIGETELDYLYEIGPEAIEAALARYKRYLPDGITIQE